MKTGRTLRRLSWAGAALMCVASLGTYLNAADAVIRGTVTDAAGKPVRYALVKVTMGPKSISRLTGPDGRYAITVPAGSYDVMAEAFGFGPRRATKDAAQAGDVNFSLTPRADVLRLSTAEAMYLLPKDEEAQGLAAACFECHGSQTVLQKRGWTAAEWAEFLPRMTVNRWGGNAGQGGGERGMRQAQLLEKYFGPESPVFGPDAEPPNLSLIKHGEPSPAVLRSTITEYNLPSPGMMPHSVAFDDARGAVWFSSYDAASNNAVRFDPKTEKWDEFKIPVAASNPHTGSVMKDGSFIIALARGGVPEKLARVTPEGKMVTYSYPEKTRWGARTSSVSPDGNTVWISTGKGDEVWAWDVKTEQFRTYPTQPGGTYDIAADSMGNAWVSQLGPGNLIRINQKTGEIKVFKTPEMNSVRGVAVDAEDNVWWADFRGHKLGRLNQKTGEIKLWATPTPNSSPYGLSPDMKRGYIWYGDTYANQVGRFDPKTETFIEYPVPTRNGAVRFPAVDPQGRVWYGGFFNGKLGMVDPDGGARSAQTAAR